MMIQQPVDKKCEKFEDAAQVTANLALQLPSRGVLIIFECIGKMQLANNAS